MSLLIVLSLAGALIQSPVVPLRAAVSGRVLEDGSHTPIAGAQVTLMPSPSRRLPGPFRDRLRMVITDSEGRYEFADLEAGPYQLSVQKAGFAPLSGPASPGMNLQAGERRNDVNVTLQRGGVIAGRVLDETGEPLVDARVMAMQKPGSRDGVSMPYGFSIPAGPGAQTNDLGEFRLFSLPPGEYYVQAMSRSDFGGASAPRGTTMLPTYFAGTSDPDAAQPIAVGAGQTADGVVIRMISAPAFRVSGTVLDDRGRPVVNAMVRLMPDRPAARPMFMMAPWSQSRTDTSGTFTINNVTNGTYTLLAVAPVVIAGPANAPRGRTSARGGGAISFGSGGGSTGGANGGGVTTEMTNGTTIEYRDDTGTRVPVTVDHANVISLEVIVRPPR